MQGATNKMLLVDAGSTKDLISQQMKNIKRETARQLHQPDAARPLAWCNCPVASADATHQPCSFTCHASPRTIKSALIFVRGADVLFRVNKADHAQNYRPAWQNLGVLCANWSGWWPKRLKWERSVVVFSISVRFRIGSVRSGEG